MIEHEFSKTERYIAFLYTYLPRLQSAALVTANKDSQLSRIGVLVRTLDLLDKPGICLEFGSTNGSAIAASARRIPARQFYGFNSLAGFSNTSVSEVLLPSSVPENLQIIEGDFSRAAPSFLNRNRQPVSFINIDCDLYSSTDLVFKELEKARKIKSGTVIYFDELINYRQYMVNEALALFEMLERTGLGISWLACHRNVRPVWDTISMIESDQYPQWNEDVEAGYRQQASLVLTEDGLDLSILKLPHAAANIRMLSYRFERLFPKVAKNLAA